MRRAWLPVALCVCLRAAAAQTAADVSAIWLEAFRRDLLQGSSDYGPPPAHSDSTLARSTNQSEKPDQSAAIRDKDDKNNTQVSADDAASREIGISRRDLQGPRLPGAEPKGPRRAFLDNLYNLEDELMPVYVRPGSQQTNKQSRKRWGDEDIRRNSQKERPPYIEQDGIKLYRVHTDPKQSFRNQFDDAVPLLSKEWGLSDSREIHGLSAENRQDRQYGNDEYKQQNNQAMSQYGSAYRNEGYDRIQYSNRNGEQNNQGAGNEVKNRPSYDVAVQQYSGQQSGRIEPGYKDESSVRHSDHRKSKQYSDQQRYQNENGLRNVNTAQYSAKLYRDQQSAGIETRYQGGNRLRDYETVKQYSDQQGAGVEPPYGDQNRLRYGDRHYGKQYNDQQRYGNRLRDSRTGMQFRALHAQAENVDRDEERSSSSSSEESEEDARAESEESESGDTSKEQKERDVSEYKQDNIRSRYVQDVRRSAGGGYGERFAARRDQELLADGMAPSTPCDCQTDTPHVMPEL